MILSAVEITDEVRSFSLRGGAVWLHVGPEIDAAAKRMIDGTGCTLCWCMNGAGHCMSRNEQCRL